MAHPTSVGLDAAGLNAAGLDAAGAAVGAPVVLAAHGSQDPRSAVTIQSLAAAVARRRGGGVAAAFLDFNAPTVPAALRVAAAGGHTPIVVPTLLTSAYHRRVDLPEVLRATGLASRVTAVLGPAEPGEEPHPLLIDALMRRLTDSDVSGVRSDAGWESAEPGLNSGWPAVPAPRSEVDIQSDGLVLIAAGTSHAPARSTVECVAAALGRRLHVPWRVGYASASGPTSTEAVAELRRAGATRIVAASYFLAAGRLYDAAAASALAGGAARVAQPLGAAEELVELVLERVAAVTV